MPSLSRLLSGALALPLLAASGPAPADPLMGPGVSRELAAARAALISDVRYGLELSVVARDTARGEITIRYRARRPADVIVDFRGPSLSLVVVNGKVVPTTFNGAHLLIPKHDVNAGENTVTAAFTALIAPAGASIIRFHDDKDGHDYLYTLLVPSDANALFPCFDQPDLKARLTLTLAVPSAWRALANGITERVDSSAAGVATYHFRETDPLPTYLFAETTDAHGSPSRRCSRGAAFASARSRRRLALTLPQPAL